MLNNFYSEPFYSSPMTARDFKTFEIGSCFWTPSYTIRKGETVKIHNCACYQKVSYDEAFNLFTNKTEFLDLEQDAFPLKGICFKRIAAEGNIF